MNRRRPTRQVALDTVDAVVGRPGTIPLLMRNPIAHARRHGSGESLDEAITLACRMRALVLRGARTRQRRPQRILSGGRPGGRRPRRSSRAGPSDDSSGEPASPGTAL